MKLSEESLRMVQAFPQDSSRVLSLLRTWLTGRRRVYVLTAFLVFTVFLLSSKAPDGYSVQSIAGQGEQLGIPGIKYSKEDEWTVPKDWDPVAPVYSHYTLQEEKFSAGTNDLKWNPDHATHGAYRDPYPDREAREYRNRYKGRYVPCEGPRGALKSEDDVYAWYGTLKDIPGPSLGDSSMLGVDQNITFDRQGRFNAYGFPRYNKNGELTPDPVNWDKVNWQGLQQQCVNANSGRFNMNPRPAPGDPDWNLDAEIKPPEEEINVSKKRSAVIFRSYDGMTYTEDMKRTMRSIIMELVINTGGEYEAFLLVQVKDKKKTDEIYDDAFVYEEVKRKTVPREFWNITILWSEDLWDKEYPLIPPGPRDIHNSQWLPVQWFAKRHPQFDHYWNWEMDVRFTGHHYDLLEALDKWTRAQPRKGMWERNARFYIPRLHKSYTIFRDYVQSRFKGGTFSTKDTSIWGPHQAEGVVTSLLTSPPWYSPSPKDDDFEWGVGEDADLITMLPMFNPSHTHYSLRFGFYNYPAELGQEGPVRRTTIITFYRISNRLLNTMNYEDITPPGHHMSSETWPQSTALHHGFKAIYAPHSIYMDRHWPAKALNFIFNNGDMQRIIAGFRDVDRRGEGSGGWEGPFGLDREHSFVPSTWYYRTDFATRLYKRFLGYEVDGIGGPEWEVHHGTFVLPPMLFHQIKDIADPEIVTPQQSKEQALAKDRAKEEAARLKDEEFRKNKAAAELKGGRVGADGKVHW